MGLADYIYFLIIIVAPFYILVSSFLLFWVAGSAGVVILRLWPAALRAALSTIFPGPALLVMATGCFEIAGAIGLLFPATTRLAASCLALLMVAMFPANVHASGDALSIGVRTVSPLPIRTLLQLVFVSAVLVAGFAG